MLITNYIRTYIEANLLGKQFRFLVEGFDSVTLFSSLQFVRKLEEDMLRKRGSDWGGGGAYTSITLNSLIFFSKKLNH